MEIYCEKESLVSSVNSVSKAVPNKTTMPILECIIIMATDNVKLTANNTEVGIESIMDAEIKETGNIAVNAKIFQTMISKLPNGRVHIKSEDNQIKIVCGKTKVEFACKGNEDFPFVEQIDDSNGFIMEQETLRRMINQVIFSASQNNNYKQMMGVLFDVSGDDLRMVALDGHRIAIRHVDVEGVSDFKIIIPSSTLSDLAKIISKGDIKISYTDSNVMFEFDNTVMVSRLIEGEYYDIDKLIKDDHTTKIIVDKQDLLECLDRTTSFIDANDRKPVVLNIGEDLGVKVNTPLGSMDESLNIQKEGEDLRIGFSPKLLMDALKAIEDDEIEIYFMGEKSPCNIIGDNYKYIVLPISLRAEGV